MQSRQYISQFPFDGRQVRLLLYRECDNRGRRLLFDSNALQKVFLQQPSSDKNFNLNHNNNKLHKNDISTSATTTTTTTNKIITSVSSKLTSSSKLTVHNTTNNAHTHKCSVNINSSCNNNHNNTNNNNSSSKKNSNQCKVQTQQQQQQQQTTTTTHSKDFVEICNEYGYKKNRNNTTEIINIGEMVFGALAMSFRGTAFKIHWLEEPARILCSEVFLTPLPSQYQQTNQQASSQSSSLCSSLSFTNLSVTPRTSISSEHSSLDGLSISSLSLPYGVRHPSISNAAAGEPGEQSAAIPRPRTNSDDVRSSYHSSTYSMGTDSGYSGLSRSLWSSMASQQYCTDNSSQGSGICSSSGSCKSEPLRKMYRNNNTIISNSLNSNCSLQRRISRNLCTSFENEFSFNDLIGFTNDYNQFQSVSVPQGGSEGRSMHRNHQHANDTHSNPEISKRRDNNMVKLLPRRAKLGLAVCITLSESFKQEMDLFCSEHAALLESMLSRVRASTEEAYINHKDFVTVMFKVWQDTQQWLNDFFTAPRIQTPVWLSVTTSGSKYSKNVAERFIKELCWLLALADTKDTNFFISTMLTATLTHHLGWVSTVLNEANSSRMECKEAAAAQRAKLLQISQTHPYNALWAQMGDLFGSIGVPPKLSRTIIYGTQKLPVERLLNILTFFIRCSEVRYTVKREIFSKQHINFIINETHMDLLKQHGLPKANSSHDLLHNAVKKNSSSGLLRSQTQCRFYDYENNIIDENALAKNMKKNEIPNVLAFRDSRFVQQELRIGNFLMDTGIEKSAFKERQQDNELIRLTITTPDNVEIYLENEAQNEGKALEAIEIDMLDTPTKSVDKSCKFMRRKSKNFFWNMVPHALREGLCLTEQQQQKQKHKVSKEGKEAAVNVEENATEYLINIEENKATTTLIDETLSFTSLSDLITQNSMGKSDRMTWGIEPTKENICLDEQMHFDLSKLIIEREHGAMLSDSGTNHHQDNIDSTTTTGKETTTKVMFVLGDNEPLINLKRIHNNNKNIEQKNTQMEEEQEQEQEQEEEEGVLEQEEKEMGLCAIHQRTHAAAQMSSSSKKHSGVKFNFEQYPQIATNYMKSKNLILSHYNLLVDKSYKLTDDDTTSATSALTTTTNMFPAESSTGAAGPAYNNCRICNSILKAYQTPSNATELEFDSDQMYYFTAPNSMQQQQQQQQQNQQQQQQQKLHTVSSVTSVETLKSAEQHTTTTKTGSVTNTPILNDNADDNRKLSENCDFNTKPPQQIRTLKMPIPSIKEVRAEAVDDSNVKMRTGFIPSMFLKFCDHYVSDMILQGTCAPPAQWESCLREDLALAARSGALISIPMENVAIIADMERWDVRFISSQAQGFPNTADHSAPVGMSQLVSTMLETVHAMNNAGISAYDCLSYIESKLHEIYLHSESLATFLLETDFCPLSYITRALNISENDVPLLLSIASVHTPQISRKCGISFR